LSAFSAVITLLSAVIWFILGYLGRQPDEAFDKNKVFKTIVAAIIVGVIVVFIGGTEQSALTTFSIFEKIGAITILEQIWNIILNRFLLPRAAEKAKTEP